MTTVNCQKITPFPWFVTPCSAEPAEDVELPLLQEENGILAHPWSIPEGIASPIFGILLPKAEDVAQAG